MITQKAFILCAGFGTRMRPLTENCPKPLLEVDGRSLLERAIDQLEAYGVEEITINTHYLAEQFGEKLAVRSSPKIHIDYEPEILNRAGPIKKAIDRFKGNPFFVLAGDGFWIDGPGLSGLEQLSQNWDPEKMDILLSLTPVGKMELTGAVGDYEILEDGQVLRSHTQTGTHMFNSLRINHPRIFDDVPEGPSDYLELMDKAEEEGRLYGVVHPGIWHHISTPADLEAVNASLKEDE